MKLTQNELLLAVHCCRSRSLSFSFSFSPRRLHRIHLFSIRRFGPVGELLLLARDLFVRDPFFSFFLESIKSRYNVDRDRFHSFKSSLGLY